MKINEKTSAIKDYRLSYDYMHLEPKSQRLIDLIMTILLETDDLEINQNCNPKDYLRIYSPDNLLLDSSKELTWGETIHALVTDVLHGDDLPSQIQKAGKKH